MKTKIIFVVVATFIIGINLAIGMQNNIPWKSIWHGTDWIASGRVISAKQIAENFEFLYKRMPDCPSGNILISNGDGTYRCGSMPASEIVFNEKQIKDALNAEIKADTGGDIRPGSGIYTGSGELSRVCAVLANQRSASSGSYVAHTTRYWYSPNDNWTYLYKNNTWNVKPSNYPLEYSCRNTREDTVCGNYATSKYNSLISSITCSITP